MRIRIFDAQGCPVIAQTVPSGGSVEVESVDRDNRTQAERNADNALAAARLKRVERELKATLDRLDDVERRRGTRVACSAVRSALLRALAAPVES